MSNENWIPTPEERAKERRRKRLYNLLFWGAFFGLWVVLAVLIAWPSDV